MRGIVSRHALWLACPCMLACTVQLSSSHESEDAGGEVITDAGPGHDAAPFDGELHRKWLALGTYYTLSSPRAADLDGDGVLDVITGHGMEAEVMDENDKDLTTFGSVSAHSGVDGRLLWNFEARQDIVGSAVFLHIDGDDVLDVVIGGRYTELVALRGTDGHLLWRFFEGTVEEARAQGLYNFYSPIVVSDQDGDGVDDLVAANGGDPTKGAGDLVRPPGQLMLVSGRTGKELASIATPDAKETYMSPTLLAGDEPQILFGSGGETISGALWRIPLRALKASDVTAAVPLAVGAETGFIGPCAIVDLNADGVDDVVGVAFGGEVVAVDGKNDALLFHRTFPGLQTYATPVVAQVTDDGVPDIWISFDEGVFPTYTGNHHYLLDGKTGETLFEEVLGILGPSGHVAADLNGDGRDEIIVGSNHATQDLTGIEDTLYAPLSYEPYWFDPVARSLHPFAEEFSRAAVSAPLLRDLDGDGDLELVVVTSDVGAMTAKYRLERFELHARVPTTPTTPAYMGVNYDGRWDPR